jgi:DNA-binding beta-propeller fold protein YncE
MRPAIGFQGLEKGSAMTNKVKFAVLLLTIITGTFWLTFRANFGASASPARLTLSAPFERKILRTGAEAPLPLRLFITAVKTDSQGRIITGETSDPVKTVVGAEAAGSRAGLMRYTKIMHGASYIDGRPDPGTRIDPNNVVVKSGNQLWPNREQPFRSQPRALALTQDGRKLYVTLPGREGYPDWRVAVVDTQTRRVLTWIDLRPEGKTLGTRPIGVKAAPLNPAISDHPYVVVLNQYGNFASVIDAVSDTVMGEFETGFYGEKLIFNRDGTRLYITDRFKDEVRAFRVDPGPIFTQLSEIPTGSTDLERANPRDLDISADGKTLYVANTLGHTIAAININADANTLVKNLPVGGLSTDVKIAGRWGIVSGQETNTKLNQPESGHGLPTKDANGVVIKNNGQPLGYSPVMTDATKATTFDDIGSELNIFDTTTNLFVFRYVDEGRDISQLVTPGQYVDLHDHADAQKIIKGSGPEQMTIKGNMLFVSMAHTDNVQAFRINLNASDPSQLLTPTGIELTSGITPQGVEVSPDGKTIYVANFQTEDISFLSVDSSGALSRGGYLAVGVTPVTPDPTTGHNGANLFATDEESGLRWFYSSAYSDDGQKSCGFCHWDGRQDGCQWNVAANAVGGTKVCPQNKDISDNWPEWYEGLNNDFMAYASACNGEVLLGERNPTPLFPQADPVDRFHAREDYVLQKTEQNSRAIGRPDLSGKAFKVGYYDMAYLQILWSQNETRRFPNPLEQFPEEAEAAKIARGKEIFTKTVAAGGAGCAECHHNGNKFTNGVLDDTFQDYNIHEPGVISETTVDGNGPFFRPQNDYFFIKFGPPQDVGTPQNFSSRNTKHLRTFWDSVPRWLHHGFAHTVREVLLAPDSPLLKPGERGFNFRTVRTDHRRGPNNLPTEVPIVPGNSQGGLAGDGRGPLYVSLDSPTIQENGKPQIDRLGTDNVAPLIAGGQINPQLAANNIQVIKDTHGKTSQLSASDLDALIAYLLSNSGAPSSLANSTSTTPTTTPSPGPTTTPTPVTNPTPAPVNSRATVQFGAPSYTVAEDARSLTVTVTRTGDTSRDFKVDYASASGSAQERSDFTTASGRLFFAAGEATKTIKVLITDDGFAEGDEGFTLSLLDASNSTEVGAPGTTTITIQDNDAVATSANPIDSNSAFIIQHYMDFLNREPEPSGLRAWVNILNTCAPEDKSCDRVEVSSGFYRSSEFQERGNFIYSFYRAAFGRIPHYPEFAKDMSRTSGFQSPAELEENKKLFAEDFLTRDEFKARYDQLSNTDYVGALQSAAGVVLPSRDALIAALQNNQMTRAQVLRAVTESAEVRSKYYNESFVVMQYFGYLRRDPDSLYREWIRIMDQKGDYRAMINGFMNSAEYRQRFGQ